MSDLANLKNQILDELIKVTDDAELDPVEKFNLLMTRYVNVGDEALLATAFEVTKQIKDASIRGTALMDLLEELEIAQSEATATAENQ